MIFFSCQSFFTTVSSINQIALGVRYVTMAMAFCTVKNKTFVILLKFGESKNLIAWQSSPWGNRYLGEGGAATLYWREKMKSNPWVLSLSPGTVATRKWGCSSERCAGVFHPRPAAGFPVPRLGALTDTASVVWHICGEGGVEKSVSKAGWEFSLLLLDTLDCLIRKRFLQRCCLHLPSPETDLSWDKGSRTSSLFERWWKVEK